MESLQKNTVGKVFASMDFEEAQKIGKYAGIEFGRFLHELVVAGGDKIEALSDPFDSFFHYVYNCYAGLMESA